MAGDWIKMRINLSQDPAVIRIAAKLEISEDEVVGKLHKFWSWANLHTEDGNAHGVTENWIDRYIGVTGFAKLISEGDGNTSWLSISDDGIHIPNFERHNGKSAKNRALTSERVSNHRGKKDVTVTALQNRYQRREEKRREEKSKEESKEREPSNAAHSFPPLNISLDDDTPTNRWLNKYLSYRPTAGHPLRNMNATDIEDVRTQVADFIEWQGEARAITLLDETFNNHPKPTTVKQALLKCTMKEETKQKGKANGTHTRPKLWNSGINAKYGKGTPLDDAEIEADRQQSNG